MKSVLMILGCWLAGVSLAIGQGLSLEVVLDQEQYLPGESLPVKVRITNYSGQDLTLGNDPGWLTFSVEDSRRVAVGKQGVLPVLGQFTLEPSTTGTKKVDLAPYFDLNQPGRYYVSAIISVAAWGQALQTKSIPFDVVRGSAVWEQEFGVPGSAKETGVPEFRKYALIQTMHSRVVRLYFRLTDTRGNRIFRVFPLGGMVSFSNPEPQIDSFSNLHVLYQTGSHAFMHCLINPDGVLIARETYEYTNTRPGLRAEKDGRIKVEGGVRRMNPSDLPPPSSATPPLNAASQQP